MRFYLIYLYRLRSFCRKHTHMINKYMKTVKNQDTEFTWFLKTGYVHGSESGSVSYYHCFRVYIEYLYLTLSLTPIRVHGLSLSQKYLTVLYHTVGGVATPPNPLHWNRDGPVAGAERSETLALFFICWNCEGINSRKATFSPCFLFRLPLLILLSIPMAALARSHTMSDNFNMGILATLCNIQSSFRKPKHVPVLVSAGLTHYLSSQSLSSNYFFNPNTWWFEIHGMGTVFLSTGLGWSRVRVSKRHIHWVLLPKGHYYSSLKTLLSSIRVKLCIQTKTCLFLALDESYAFFRILNVQLDMSNNIDALTQVLSVSYWLYKFGWGSAT